MGADNDSIRDFATNGSGFSSDSSVFGGSSLMVMLLRITREKIKQTLAWSGTQ
jgi:hypothetical protein